MEIKFDSSQTDFFKKLRNDVGDYFRKKNMKSTGGLSAWIKAIAFVPALAGIYIWLVAFTPDAWWILILLYAVLGVVVALIGFNMMHDGAHGAFSHNKVVNKIMAYSLNVLGGNHMMWNRKHNINHHSYTNIESVDDDLDLGPLIRLHDNQKKRWFHKYQHIYAMPLYGTSYMMWIYVSDFKKYFSGKVADRAPLPPMKFSEHLTFWGSKLFHVFIFLLLPLLILGSAKAIIGYIVATMVTGFIIAIIFQLAHIVEGAGFETPSTSGNVDIKTEWAVHQVRTTVNFATQNKILTWLLGGLNYQMVHHLFPKISHVHYPAIHPIIISTCRQYKLNYIEFPTLSSAIRSHLRYLKTTGRAA